MCDFFFTSQAPFNHYDIMMYKMIQDVLGIPQMGGTRCRRGHIPTDGGGGGGVGGGIYPQMEGGQGVGGGIYPQMGGTSVGGGIYPQMGGTRCRRGHIPTDGGGDKV